MLPLGQVWEKLTGKASMFTVNEVRIFMKIGREFKDRLEETQKHYQVFTELQNKIVDHDFESEVIAGVSAEIVVRDTLPADIEFDVDVSITAATGDMLITVTDPTVVPSKSKDLLN